MFSRDTISGLKVLLESLMLDCAFGQTRSLFQMGSLHAMHNVTVLLRNTRAAALQGEER